MIIGVCGKKRSGKDTVSHYLEDMYKYAVYSFAFPIKQACRAIFDWNESYTDGPNKETVDPRWGISPRQAMQHMGTEWGQYGLSRSFEEFARVTGRNLWAHRFYHWYVQYQDDTVVSDLRFPHEADVIRKLAGKIIKVDRPEASEVVDLHPSEMEMISILPDVIIENSGTIEDLYDSVDAIMEEWKNEV